MHVRGLLTGSLAPSLRHTAIPDRIRGVRVRRAKARCVRRSLRIEKYKRLVDEMVDSAAYDPRVWDYHKEIRRLSNLVHRDRLFIRRTEHDVSARHDLGS